MLAASSKVILFLKTLTFYFGTKSNRLHLLICREYIYGNTKPEIRCFRKYILYI